MPSRSDFEFRQQGLMSQTLSDLDPIFRDIAGCDKKTANAIGLFTILGEHNLVDLKSDSWSLIMDILKVKVKVSLASSDKTNEITKMGLRMPKKDLVYDGDAD
jgi:hypothetical protein